MLQKRFSFLSRIWPSAARRSSRHTLPTAADVCEPRTLLSGTSPAVFDHASSQWSFGELTASGQVEESGGQQYGLPGDTPVTGDWDGNGVDNVGVVRQVPGDRLLHWYLDLDGDLTHDVQVRFGIAGDTPVTGDWNGDGIDDVGVVRQMSDGLLHWFFDTDGDPRHERKIRYGLPGDIPVPGDWNGDGRDDVGVVRRQNGFNHWYLDGLGNGGLTHDRHQIFGLATDTPVVGDWHNDGRDDVGVTREGASPNGNLYWLLDKDGDPGPEQTFRFGRPGQTAATVGEVYTPIQKDRINLRAESLYVDTRVLARPDLQDERLGTVKVNVRLPGQVAGDFKIALFWSANPRDRGTWSEAGELTRHIRQKGDHIVPFTHRDVARKPADATHLVAIVDPDNDIAEWSEGDNARFLEIGTRTQQNFTPPPTQPRRTFAFLIEGFSGSSDDKSGMDDLKETLRKKGLSDEMIHVTGGGPTKSDIISSTRRTMNRVLREANYRPTDRVILAGHSLGGDAARILAWDVAREVEGIQAAFAVVTIDPIDFDAVPSGGDQSGRRYGISANVDRANVRNVVQTRDGEFLKGYRIVGAENIDITPGPDGIRGTADDSPLTHTEIDNDSDILADLAHFLKLKTGSFA